MAYGLSAFEQVMQMESHVLHDSMGFCTIILPGDGKIPDAEGHGATNEAAANPIPLV